MTIKNKFTLLLSGVFLLLFLGMAAVMVLRIPINKMEKELDLITEYKSAVSSEIVALGLMYNFPLAQTIRDIEILAEVSREKAAALENIVLLSTLNEDTEEALTRVRGMEVLSEMKRVEMIQVIENINIYNTGEYSASSSTRLLAMMRDQEILENNLPLVYHLDRLNQVVNQMLVNHQTNLSGIDDRIEQFKKAINRQSRRITLIVLSSLFVLMTGVFILALFMLRGIGSRIQFIAATVREMKEGQLSHFLSAKGHDDISQLTHDVDSFLGSLRESLLSVNLSLVQTLNVKDIFLGLSKEMSSSIKKVDRRVGQFIGNSESLDRGVEGSRNSVLNIKNQLQILEEEIDNQASMVEESSSSIHQMSASLASIYNMTGKNKETTEQLDKTSQQGEDLIHETTELLSRMTSSISHIQEMAEVIEGIASQTNLLAMNAAIEAAHAGEEGRGFAVVADEIRKLAEASSESSQEIRSKLDGIINNIEKATKAGGNTQQIFIEVSRQVGEVLNSFEQVYHSISEVQQGGEQIVTAMSSLQETTHQVKDQARAINENALVVEESVEAVTHISSSIRSGSQEIQQDMESLAHLASNSEQDSLMLEKNTEMLRQKLNFFKLDEQE